MNDIANTINEIKKFLEGRNNDIKYVVNVETDNHKNYGTCVIHEPGKEKRMENVKFTPFLYIKDIKKLGHTIYNGDESKQIAMMKKYGITITKMKTGNQPRLVNGYPYKVTSTINYNSITSFFRDGGLDPFEKKLTPNGQVQVDKDGRPLFKNRDLFYLVQLNDQFFISSGVRLYKGFEDYSDIHKVIFDIETTGLRYEHERIFAIGVKDNRGFEYTLEADKDDDDEAEKRLIQDFFNLISLLKPAIIAGYNSEDFDYIFITERSKILDMKISGLPTTLNPKKNIYKKSNSTVKFGNTTEYYSKTIAWGYSVIDIMHAAKKTAAINSDIKNVRLKYICQFEDIAKKDRMYIDGSGGNIYRYWKDNPIFIINPENNNYVELPENLQSIGKIAASGHNLNDDESKLLNNWIDDNVNNIGGNYKFEFGKVILNRYLLDDLWETEQVDNLYNQSSFLLAKMIPTSYARICTMGTAAIWNLLMTTWSYENDLAIPHPDGTENFSGGLARCYKTGYSKDIVKIDFASLYPMEQLTWDIFPMFDITNVIKKMLTYLTTTRNIYKKLAVDDPLTDNEIELLKEIDYESYDKLIAGSFTDEERNLYKVKQLPIKILNNSLFGALGSGFAFNWSDNICAARITCSGRLYLRRAITYFKDYGLEPLLAVTDGVNFGIPNKTKIRVTDEGVNEGVNEGVPEEMWTYKGKKGVSALIEKFNEEEMHKPYMSVDDDGHFDSCLNLSRINYALMYDKKDKKTGEMKKTIKYTGNTIKSKVMPEYIEDFINNAMKMILTGKGADFVNYYYDYAETIFYRRITAKKIASKSKVKSSIKEYLERGVDVNGKQKAMQAHMELLILQRENIAREIFEEKFEFFNEKTPDRLIEDYDIIEIQEIVSTYMPPEPEIGTTIYYVNTGTRKSHGDVKKHPKTGEPIINSTIIDPDDLESMDIGEYNVDKYIAAFNERVSKLLDGFSHDVREKLLVKIDRKKVKLESGEKVEEVNLIKHEFEPKQLNLVNFDNDGYEDSLYLENKEIEFWNKSGYDPKKIWDGFLTKDDDEHGLLYPEIYQHAIDHVSNEMVSKGFPAVKSVNDTLVKNDFILIKGVKGKKIKYDLGLYNGTFIEIVRSDINVPKSPIELELEEIQRQKDAEIERLRIENYENSEEAIAHRKKMLEYFNEFKVQWKLPDNTDMNVLFDEIPSAKFAFDDFVKIKEGVPDDEEIEYYDID